MHSTTQTLLQPPDPWQWHSLMAVPHPPHPAGQYNNTLCHTSNTAQERGKELKASTCPPDSPDLNRIVHSWDVLVSQRYPPATVGPPWIGLDTARQSPEVLCPYLNRSEPRLMQEIPWIHDPWWGLPTKGYPRTLTHSEASLDRTCSDLLRRGHGTSGGYPVGSFESDECEVGLVRSEEVPPWIGGTSGILASSTDALPDWDLGNLTLCHIARPALSALR